MILLTDQRENVGVEPPKPWVPEDLVGLGGFFCAMSKDLENIRHSCAHLLAAAVLQLYPDAKNTIGPAIENGFYYDFEFSKPLSEEDLPKIEAKMEEILKSWEGFERIVVSSQEAKERFKDNPYKLELIDEIDEAGEEITLYESGDFVDLCRGGHSESPKKDIGAFKLLSIAGAYWRGDEKKKMLTRIYGTCFGNKEELEKYLWQLEEAKKRDHRKIGSQMDLWTFSELVGSGLPLFTQKGALVRGLITGFVEELQSKQGIEQVWTPQIAKGELFRISGHYDKYKDDMFLVKSNYSEDEFYLKPMNCPQHTQIYASKPRSYKDLPIRMSDFAMLYRDERPGQLLGLSRTRSFSQDDCHIFCREDQIVEEMNKALMMTKEIMKAYGFTYKYRLSIRDPQHPEKYLGSEETWKKAEALSEQVLKDNNIDYFVGVGEAAFYAPKLDLMATDSIGREWQLSTLQIDFVQPERFNLKYIDENGKEKRPVMLHRAISGSPERLMAILIEHFAGAFPIWLAPVQVVIVPITDRNIEYGKKVEKELKELGIRVEIDERSEKMQAKIRDAQLQKIPYMLIIGDKEQEVSKVAVRTRKGEDMGVVELQEFVKNIVKQIDEKSLV